MNEGEQKTNKNKDTKSGKSKYAANENVAVGQERLLCLGVGSPSACPMAVKFDCNFALGKQREKQQTRGHWRLEFSYSSEPLSRIYLSAAKTAARRAAEGEAPDPLLTLAAHANPPPLQQA
jgi:hypothetical protein